MTDEENRLVGFVRWLEQADTLDQEPYVNGMEHCPSKCELLAMVDGSRHHNLFSAMSALGYNYCTYKG